MEAGLETELRHVRDLLSRVVMASRVLLAELEVLGKLRNDAELAAAVRKLLERRVPELRIVVDRSSGESSGSRGGTGSEAKP